MMKLGVIFQVPQSSDEKLDPIIDVVERVLVHCLENEVTQELHPVDWSYIAFQEMLSLLQLQNRIADSGGIISEQDIQDINDYWLKISSSCIGALESMNGTETRTTERE